MNKAILRFILKAIAIPLPIIVPFVVLYIWANPFRDIPRDSSFFQSADKAAVGLNKGMVTVRNYEKQKQTGRRYNAFIFGSSISCYYDTDHWAELLRLRDGAGDVRPYHFDSSSESLAQMADKVFYLDHVGDTISYALVVLDPLIMARDTDPSPMSINPPQLQLWRPLHWLKYHYTFFRASTNSDFLKSWIPGRLSDTPYLIGRKPVFEVQPIVYNPINNQESVPEWDSLIALNPREFYAEYPLSPSPDSITINGPVLDKDKIAALKEIFEVFNRYDTDYRIVIGPNRKKTALNPVDLKILEDIFGADRVYDFSLTRANDLANDTLMYDNTHYRPVYADSLMNAIYGGRALPGFRKTQ